MQPIVLTTSEREFLARVHAYCGEGLNQSEMARRESLSLPGFQSRLRGIGFDIAAHTSREVVRLRSGESLASLLTAGVIATEDEPEPAQAVPVLA